MYVKKRRKSAKQWLLPTCKHCTECFTPVWHSDAWYSARVPREMRNELSATKNGGTQPLTCWVLLMSMYRISTMHTGVMGVYRPQEISRGWSPRLIYQGRYTSITSVHAVDICLIPWRWAVYLGIPPSSVAVEHPWAVASFVPLLPRCHTKIHKKTAMQLRK